ncbi:hypothetical protein IW21_09405 [Campylobacter fetus subsp. venerealis]|nr:hypothetical protein IW21_09405 [Campylobacter fetus subsp. venerealis]PHJ03584.1 hypothetical protein IW23_09460 [Campylobacter fetus subsp. venerealis]
MRLVYVASPYASISAARDENQRRFYAKKIATSACKKVMEAGYWPISPVLAFCDIYDEKTEREEVIKACLELLSDCSYIYFANSVYSKNSAGMKIEKRYARELGIVELEF